jgi:hypothetical protein
LIVAAAPGSVNAREMAEKGQTQSYMDNDWAWTILKSNGIVL